MHRPEDFFTGHVEVTAVHGVQAPSRLTATHVRFAAGARTHWHRHELGQFLVCTEGAGYVGARDGEVTRLRAGDAVWSPPGEQHWHGAAEDAPMCHYGLLEAPADGASTVWLEPVDDEHYRAAHRVDRARPPADQA